MTRSSAERAGLYGYLLGPLLALLAMQWAAHLEPTSSWCLFRDLTGLPCPACGICHSVAALLALDWAGAWSANPAGFVVLIALIAQSGLSLGLLRTALLQPVQRYALLSGRLVPVLLLFCWLFKIVPAFITQEL